MKEQGFIVSALKYRPAEWDQVVGQKGITSTLQNAIASEEIAKAYLFCGPRGVGKTTSARIFAKAINAKYIEDGQDLSFNIFELDAASNNSVDDIRQLIDQVRIQPQLGKYKVYIIDEVHMLSTQAFNAFLKTLEEPPPHAIFILATTEKHKVLPTILSRCQIYDFQRIQIKDMVEHLARIAKDQEVTYEEEALHLIASKADGALRDALSLFDQMVSFTGKNLDYTSVANNLHVLDHEYYNRLVQAMVSGDVASIMLTYDEILKQGFDSLLFLIGLAEHMRNVLVAKDESTVSLLDCPDAVRAQFIEQARSMHAAEIIGHLDTIQKAEVSYRASKNKRLLTEITLMKLCSAAMPRPEATPEKKKPIVSNEPVSSPSVAPAPQVSVADQAPAPEAKEPVTEAKATAPVQEVAAPAPKEVSPLPQEIPTPTSPTAESEGKQPVAISTDASPITEAPVAKGRTRRKRGISLTLSEEDNEDLGTSEFNDNPEMVEGKTIVASELHKAWGTYADIIKDQNKYSFHSTLVNKDPEILDDHTIKIKLENEVQMEHLNQEKADLMSFIREKLDHPGIRLEAEIDIEDKANIAYRTPREQYQEMMEKNPTLKKLSQQFDLDLEY